MSALRVAWIVLAKEARDGLRDRRALVMAFFLPLLGPLLIVASVATGSHEAGEAEDLGVRVAFAGAERAPNLVAFLEAHGVVAEPPVLNAERAVRTGRAAVAVVIPEEFEQELRAGRPAPVRVVSDASRRYTAPKAERVRKVLDAWARQTAAQRLLVRGVHPRVAQPLAVEMVDVSTARSRAALVFMVAPYFFVLSMLLGGMPVATDATAGERERQTLEPLLATPAARGALVAGKIGAAAVFALAALLLSGTGFALVPALLPVQRMGFTLRLDPGVVARAVAVCLPLLLASSALMVLVAARARTFRAAQTSISFLSLALALPGVFIALSPVEIPRAVRAVPGIAEQLLVVQLVRGDPVDPSDVARAAVVSLAAAVVLAVLAARLLDRGRLLEGG